jgi:hypothetical protein
MDEACGTVSSNFVANLTAEFVREALPSAGVSCAPKDVVLVARDQRWAVSLPGERIALFAASELGNRRLDIERHVLRLLAERRSYQVPRLFFVSDRGFDLRQMVPGRCDPWGLFHRCQTDLNLAHKSAIPLARSSRSNISKLTKRTWLDGFHNVSSGQSQVSGCASGLSHVVDDHDLIRIMDQVIERYEAVPVGAEDRALVHGDVGLHNLALDPLVRYGQRHLRLRRRSLGRPTS